MTQGQVAVRQAIEMEFPEIVARRMVDHFTCLWANVVGVIKATRSERRVASPMGEYQLQVREPVEAP